MKRFAATIISILMLFVVHTQVQAADNDLENLCKKYNLVDVETVPNGVTPVKYDTVEAADKALQQLNSNNNKLSYMANVGNRGDQTESWLCSIFGWLNLKVNYTYEGNQFLTCDKISTYLSGWTFGITWTETYSVPDITEDRLSLKAHAEGTMDHYMIVQGFIKLWTKHYELDHTFTNAQGGF